MKTIITIFICSLFAFSDQANAKSALTPNEAEVLTLTNQEREKAGLMPLSINNNLMDVAGDHSANMAQACELSHELHGRDLSQRIETTDYPYRYIGENIAESPFSVSNVIKMWMTSEGHRRNILDPSFKEIGIGIAVGQGGQSYYTQVFGARD